MQTPSPLIMEHILFQVMTAVTTLDCSSEEESDYDEEDEEEIVATKSTTNMTHGADEAVDVEDNNRASFAHEVEDDDDDDMCQDEFRASFRKICERLKQNDETLVSYVQQKGEAIEYWKDIRRLGNALATNKHLQCLRMTTNLCICKCRTSNRAGQVLRHGIAQSQKLNRLSFTCCCADMQKLLLQGVGMSSTMQQLKLSGSRVHITTVAQLLSVPTPPPPIINNNNNNMDDFCCQLTHLTLINSFLSNIDMLHISLALKDNKSLISLNLDKNYITNVGVIYFCQHWRDDSPLQELNLRGNEFDSKGAMRLLRSSVNHTALRTLALGGNGAIGHDGLRQVGDFLPHLLVQSLEIQGCCHCRDTVCQHAQEAACRALAAGLRSNSILKSLRIGGNKLGANGVHRMMHAARFHPSLEVLSMEMDQSVGLLGIKRIGTLLPNVPLKRLDLDFTSLGSWNNQPLSRKAIEAGQALLNGVQKNDTLTQFNMHELPEKWLKPIQFHVELNKACRPLLRNEGITPAIWAHALTKFHHKGQISHVYYTLLEQPWLVATAATAATTSQTVAELLVPTVAMGDQDNSEQEMEANSRRRKYFHSPSPPLPCCKYMKE